MHQIYCESAKQIAQQSFLVTVVINDYEKTVSSVLERVEGI